MLGILSVRDWLLVIYGSLAVFASLTAGIWFFSVTIVSER